MQPTQTLNDRYPPGLPSPGVVPPDRAGGMDAGASERSYRIGRGKDRLGGGELSRGSESDAQGMSVSRR